MPGSMSAVLYVRHKEHPTLFHQQMLLRLTKGIGQPCMTAIFKPLKIPLHIYSTPMYKHISAQLLAPG